jgi:hypothetical protein
LDGFSARGSVHLQPGAAVGILEAMRKWERAGPAWQSAALSVRNLMIL